MSAVQADGNTLRQHLQAAMRAGAPEPALLRDQPRPPEEFAGVLSLLGRFAAPLDWAQLEAWGRLTGRTFARWELRVLEHADRMRMK